MNQQMMNLNSVCRYHALLDRT